MKSKAFEMKCTCCLWCLFKTSVFEICNENKCLEEELAIGTKNDDGGWTRLIRKCNYVGQAINDILKDTAVRRLLETNTCLNLHTING